MSAKNQERNIGEEERYVADERADIGVEHDNAGDASDDEYL